MLPTNRRSFLKRTLTLPLIAATAASTSAAQTPVLQPARKGHLKLSCNMFSFNEPLRGGTMTLEQAIEACADLGFDAIDPTGYYFTGYPAPPDDAYCFHIKKHAFRLGLDMSGTGVRNDFTLSEASARDAEIAHVKRWVEVAARLDAPVLRIFDGRGQPVDKTAYETTFSQVVDAVRTCVAYGREHGVMIVYQPHNEFLKTSDEVLRLLEAVGSDWLGLNLDIGSLRVGDPYEEVARLAPHAYTWQIKETVFRGTVEEKTDLTRIATILQDSAYRGYIPLETLGPGDPVPKLERFVAEVRRDLL
ncbi:MAG: sugar phosphate isomerase/epimerase family protein [Rhodothermales bacterium]|nr:sugar phosphate isomerase/epimerase family protein [Rhodothermales bacterium]